jgi:hypothetical protein
MYILYAINRFSNVIIKIDALSITNDYIMLSNKAGQNQVNSVQIVEDFLIIGGWENGPGTHTGDNDIRLVMADGFVEVFPVSK